MGFKVASKVRGLSDAAFRAAYGTEEQAGPRWRGCIGRAALYVHPACYSAQGFDADRRAKSLMLRDS